MAVCADFILSTVLIIALRQSRSGVARCGIALRRQINKCRILTYSLEVRTDSALDVLVLYTITTGEFLAGCLRRCFLSDLSGRHWQDS